jgi:glyoxylase I family protein
MSVQPSAERSTLLPKLPMRMHHHAYVSSDLERTRHFYEDIIGLPLAATWVEATEESYGTLQFCHVFFAVADGSALAFFNFKDPKMQAQFDLGSRNSDFYHIAFAVDEKTQQEIIDRCKGAGFKTFITDHGYCKSLYVNDPDGLMVEFTVDPSDVAEIDAFQRKIARKSLDAWQAGDTRPNNQMRPHG